MDGDTPKPSTQERYLGREPILGLGSDFDS